MWISLPATLNMYVLYLSPIIIEYMFSLIFIMINFLHILSRIKKYATYEFNVLFILANILNFILTSISCITCKNNPCYTQTPCCFRQGIVESDNRRRLFVTSVLLSGPKHNRGDTNKGNNPPQDHQHLPTSICDYSDNISLLDTYQLNFIYHIFTPLSSGYHSLHKL
jgi:hypothetical protein